MTRRAIFLDKDGTLVRNVPYNVDRDRLELAADAGAALRALQALGYCLIVVSNQSGVARGYFQEQALTAVRRDLEAVLRDEGVTLDGFYYCPHHPDGAVASYAVECACRKPRPGLLLRAARDHDVDVAASWAIGDVLDDVEAGHRAGCRAVLIDNGSETEWVLSEGRTPDHVASGLVEVASVMTALADGAAATESEP